MAFNINPGFMRRVTVSYMKADGTPGEIEGLPVWSLSEATLADLTVDAGGMFAFVKHNGAVGETTLTISADGDLGAGVHPIVLVPEPFSMQPPLGATAGTVVVGAEEVIV